MKCPECGAWSIIKETRTSPTFGYRRRRECANYHSFTTQEVVIPEEVIREEKRRAMDTARAAQLALRKSKRKTA